MSRLRIGIRARAGSYTEPHNNAPLIFGPRQANLVLIAYASSEGSGEEEAVSQEDPSDRKPDPWPL